MDGLIKERDVLLIGKDENGSDTFDFPVTRLGNIEAMGDSAEVKENPDVGDFLPIIDTAGGEKMKKTSVGKILTPLNDHISDKVKHISAEERNAWNSKADGAHTHDDRYYTKAETDGKLSGEVGSGHTHDGRYYTESEVDNLLNGKANANHAHDERYYTENEIDGKLAGKANVNHTHPAATQSSAGFMSAEDKKRLDISIASQFVVRYFRFELSINDSAVKTIPFKIDQFFVCGKIARHPADKVSPTLFFKTDSENSGEFTLNDTVILETIHYEWSESEKATRFWAAPLSDYGSISQQYDILDIMIIAFGTPSDQLFDIKVGSETDGAPITAAFESEYEENEIERLKSQLESIDKQSIRPLRAIAAGTDNEEDTKKLSELEEQAKALRKEIARLNAESEV